ncbi:MAG: hypothetical protein Q7O66_18780, partial [Dehalococcoidia bacterium]|nr:hypothetical protein [Dehalococcoidia bacterium]
VNRLSDDKRFGIEFDYKGDFLPCPVTVTIHDPSIDTKEIAERMFRVAAHPVRSGDQYIAGCAADAERHKPH